jgi:hypothetical protein
MVLGVGAGFVAGVVLAAPAGGDALVTPLLLPLVGMFAGVVIGGAVGLAIELHRAKRQSAEVEHSSRPPPAELDEPPAPRPDLGPPPAAEDGSPAPEAWYDDPLADGRLRFWDGQEWTGHTWTPRRRSRR